MGKFLQISTELLPLIHVKIGFHALSLAYLINFSSNAACELIL